ncbi:bifunctional nicotinamidase/pyrazinamidase [Fulvivirga sp. 29W222]|uniref:Nicotinamidase n=1 Tax=Fulvivirga marina TaxID=2494733 RepID=A0A937FZA4_9BACT|nr:bifunctional nicotinamidase/pyrazinamidase [Fulvivirga marina]MBL6448754.1 bifunctional nicotinamidase/pyrazinamidase [Fulvivirga marina]
MNALMIVDIQNDFTPEGSLAVPHGDEIIPIVNELQKSFELVIATQDWHPRNHKSFASNHQERTPFETTMLQGLEQILWPDHCVQGSSGAKFHASLHMEKIEAIFRKGMNPEIDSYSGFYDNGHKKSTGLSGYLKERKVKNVYICGLAADFCVFYTAKDALREGFGTYVIEDATRAIDQNGFLKAKYEIKALGGKTIKSKDILGPM